MYMQKCYDTSAGFKFPQENNMHSRIAEDDSEDNSWRKRSVMESFPQSLVCDTVLLQVLNLILQFFDESLHAYNIQMSSRPGGVCFGFFCCLWQEVLPDAVCSDSDQNLPYLFHKTWHQTATFSISLYTTTRFAQRPNFGLRPAGSIYIRTQYGSWTSGNCNCENIWISFYKGNTYLS